MKRIVLLLCSLGILSAMVYYSQVFSLFFTPKSAYAVGNLTVDWGVMPGMPLFTITNVAPGDVTTKSVMIANSASNSIPLGVKAVSTGETNSLSQVLDIVISDNGADVYGGTSVTGKKTVAQFFSESQNPDGIFLATISAQTTKSYQVRITFDKSAGNQYQNSSVQFDIIIGISVAIPSDCEEINLKNKFPIFGTEGDDRIQGTNADDVIVTFAGNDTVFGHGGNDCIIGGSGNDELRGEEGNDFLFGNEGNDLLIGAVGDDMSFGGEDEDILRGENGNDFLLGEEGNDVIIGGNGNDQIEGGNGLDTLSGENGNDTIFGNQDNDVLNGGAGNDMLWGGEGNDTGYGGAGNDFINGELGDDTSYGDAGVDTCSAEIKKTCE